VLLINEKPVENYWFSTVSALVLDAYEIKSQQGNLYFQAICYINAAAVAGTTVFPCDSITSSSSLHCSLI